MKIVRLCKRCKTAKSPECFSGPRTKICNPCVSKKLWLNKNYSKNQLKLKNRLQKQLLMAVKSKYFDFAPDCEEIIGISAYRFRLHMESKFKDGMNWNNHGNANHSTGIQKWHIDHIIPLSTFQTIWDIKNLFHYTNIQPLWDLHNRKKFKKLPEQLKKEAEEREQRKNS